MPRRGADARSTTSSSAAASRFRGRFRSSTTRRRAGARPGGAPARASPRRSPTVPVLAPLPADAHRALAAAAASALFGDGEVIVREGDAGASMFIVRRGRVAITVGAISEKSRSPRPAATSARCRCSPASRARRPSPRAATAPCSKSAPTRSAPTCRAIRKSSSRSPKPPTRGEKPRPIASDRHGACGRAQVARASHAQVLRVGLTLTASRSARARRRNVGSPGRAPDQSARVRGRRC